MPSPRLSPKIARLLSMQFLTGPVLIVAVLVYVLYHTRPNHMGTTGGIDSINSFITWFAFIVVFGALISIQLIFARQLRSEARGERRGVKSW